MKGVGKAIVFPWRKEWENRGFPKGSYPGGGSECYNSGHMQGMEKGPDGTHRQLSDLDLSAQSAGISPRRRENVKDVANQIVDPNLDPEERLLEKEEDGLFKTRSVERKEGELEEGGE